MSLKLSDIEKILETIGSRESGENTQHRYELRRALLTSKFCAPRFQRWDRLMTYTVPFVGGVMMVVVFTFMAMRISAEPEIGPQTVLRKVMVVNAPVSTVPVEPIRIEEILSHTTDVKTVFVDSYLPLAHEWYVRTQ